MSARGEAALKERQQVSCANPACNTALGPFYGAPYAIVEATGGVREWHLCSWACVAAYAASRVAS